MQRRKKAILHLNHSFLTENGKVGWNHSIYINFDICHIEDIFFTVLTQMYICVCEYNRIAFWQLSKFVKTLVLGAMEK